MLVGFGLQDNWVLYGSSAATAMNIGQKNISKLNLFEQVRNVHMWIVETTIKNLNDQHF